MANTEYKLDISESKSWSCFWEQVREKERLLVDLADQNALFQLTKLLQDKSDSLPFDINSGNGLNGWNALHFAVFNDNEGMVRLLIQNGAKLDIETACKSSVLHIAVQVRSYKMAKFVLTAGLTNLDGQDEDLNTALHLAAESNQADLVQLLLAGGCNPHIRNNQLQEPAHLTSSQEVLDVFAQRGVNTSSPGKRRWVQDRLVMNSKFDIKLRYIQRLMKPTMSIITETIHAPFLSFVKKLGQGSFGEVYLVFDQEKQIHYALKSLSKDKVQNPRTLQYARTELNVLKSVKSRYVTQFKASLQNSRNLFILEECIFGRDLNAYLGQHGTVSEEEAANIAMQVLLGLNDIHNKGFIYRDMKPHNIMIQRNGAVKLIDFGLSKQLSAGRNRAYSFCGSIAYLAPEMILRAGHDKSIDMYSLGVLIYELIHGQPPYYDQTRQLIFNNILNGKLKFKPTISDRARDLIKELMERDPRMRPCFEEIRISPFFRNVSIEHLEELHKVYYDTEAPTEFLDQVFDFDEANDNEIPDWDSNISYSI